MRKIYPLFLLTIFSFFLQAQELTIKGLVTVQSDALLYVEGDVLIESTGVLDIQSNGADHGIVEVNLDDVLASPGEWTCDGITESSVGGEGEVHFIGIDVDYNIQGSSVSFPNLIIDATTFTAGVNVAKVNILDNIEISSSLDLSNGRMVTAAGMEVYVSNSSEDAVKSSDGGFGDQSSNYVEGSLRREITLGNYYRYPIGCTPDAPSGIRGYNPAFIDFSGANARIPANATSIVGRFDYIDDPGSIHHHQLAHSCYSTSTGYQFLELHWMVKRFGYWDFLPNGNPEGWDYDFYVKPDVDRILAQNSDLTHIKIIKAPRTFTVNAAADWSDYVEESGDGCDMVNVYNDNIYWKPGPNTSTYPYDLTDSIRASGLITFSRFGLSGGTGAGLPIELLYLEAHPVYQQPIENSYIRVNWATATEVNNAGFEVHRSTDGLNFSMIKWVDGAGNSSTNLYYGMDDRDVVPNQRYYYYLRQVDYDGTDDTTDVVSAIISAPSTFIISEFIPNPAQNNSWLEFTTSDERDINVTVYNTLGQTMTTVDHHLVEGNNRIDFDFNLLADGTYFAIILSDNQVFNRKLILTK